MAVATQFCIGLENKPGALAELCGILRRADVNVDALYVSEDEDCTWVNFVASPVPVANDVLAEAGHDFFTEKVLVVRVDDRPGELERVSSKLAEASININYVYGSCVNGSCTLVFNVDDMAGAEKAVGA